MRNTPQIRPILRKSNKYMSAQISVDNTVLITTTSKTIRACLDYKKEFSKLILLYNTKQISYKTMLFLLQKVSKKADINEGYMPLKIATEYSWESGLSNPQQKIGFYSK